MDARSGSDWAGWIRDDGPARLADAAPESISPPSTSNATGLHRGPKRKPVTERRHYNARHMLRLLTRAPSVQCTSCCDYFSSSSVVSHILCAMRVFDIRASLSSPRLSLWQILFYCIHTHPPYLMPRELKVLLQDIFIGFTKLLMLKNRSRHYQHLSDSACCWHVHVCTSCLLTDNFTSSNWDWSEWRSHKKQFTGDDQQVLLPLCQNTAATQHHRPLAGTHCAYPRSWVDLGDWLHTEINFLALGNTVTHPSTNLDQRKLTLLIETNVPTTAPNRQPVSSLLLSSSW